MILHWILSLCNITPYKTEDMFTQKKGITILEDILTEKMSECKQAISAFLKKTGKFISQEDSSEDYFVLDVTLKTGSHTEFQKTQLSGSEAKLKFLGEFKGTF